MPSKALFRAKDRPSGLEFPSCKVCNNQTSAADSLVAFLARLYKYGNDVQSPQFREACKYLLAANQGAPGLLTEFLGQESSTDVIMQTPGGVLLPLLEMHAGPIASSLLNVWSAKLGLALYYEHAGHALPMSGGVYAIWFLNGGFNQEAADNYLSILPSHGTLKQGRGKSASGQFDYRFNTDEKSIVAALTHFHGNIHFFTIAMAEPGAYNFPDDSLPYGKYLRPGQILREMPKRTPAILMPRTPPLKSDWLHLPARLR